MLTLVENYTNVTIKGGWKELNRLSSSLSFLHPERFLIDSHQEFRISKGLKGWDGRIRPMTMVKGEGIIPRPLLSRVINKCEELGISIASDSIFIKSPFGGIGVDDIDKNLLQSDFDLDYDQRLCISSWISNCVGINKVTVSGGKTAMFAAASKLILSKFPDRKLVYATQSERLVKQAYSDFTKFLPGVRITQYGGGKKDPTGDIVIATLAMINRNLSSLREDRWFKDKIAFMVDECHHIISPSGKVISQLFNKSLFKFGASGSTKEDNVMDTFNMESILGPIINRVEVYGLIKKGRVAVPHIYIVDNQDWLGKFDHVPIHQEKGSEAVVFADGNTSIFSKGVYLGKSTEKNKDGSVKTVLEAKMVDGSVEEVISPIIKVGYSDVLIDGSTVEVKSSWCLFERYYDRSIIRFKQRNDLIVEWASYYMNRSLTTLIVATRSIHVNILYERMMKAVSPELVRTLTGGDGQNRDEVISWWKNNPGSCLISSIIKEGVSVNEIRACIVADYIVDWEYLNQIIGRTIRKKDSDNTSYVTVFVERQHRDMLKSSKAMFNRLKCIRGYIFYHPLVSPNDIPETMSYDTSSLDSGDVIGI